MISLYFAGVLFGGVLIAGSLLGGHGEHGGGHGGNGHDHDHAHGEHGGRGNLLGRLPFFSLRFWAFATAFFGLAGAALTVAGGLGVATPFVAAGVGLGCGALAGRALGRLGRQAVGQIGDASAHLGREGQVLLPLEPGRRGKIRLSIGGISTDLVAELDASATAPLARGEVAYVVGLRGNVALVERSPTAGRLMAPAPPLETKKEDKS